MFIKRQEFFQDANGNIYEVDSFWWTQTGYIVKWSILTGIFLIFFCWFVFGYMHAQSRMKKGLPPLAYHRWLVPRYQRERFTPQPQSHFTFYQNQNPQYGGRYNNMQNYQEPPPVYNGELPPTYQPPNSTKVESSQQNTASSSAPVPEVPLPPRVKTKASANPLRWLNRR